MISELSGIQNLPPRLTKVGKVKILLFFADVNFLVQIDFFGSQVFQPRMNK